MKFSNLYFTFCFFFSLACYSQEAEQIKYYTEKAEKFLDKEKALGFFYSIDIHGVSLYANTADRNSNKPEFFLEWKDLGNFRSDLKTNPEEVFRIYKTGKYSVPLPDIAVGKSIVKHLDPLPDKRFSGKKIAIDPGHIAHDLITGDLEKKHIKFKKDPLHGLSDSVEFAEGMLTYATAALLKQKLESQGAIVMLTRPEGLSAFGKTFQEWKKNDLRKSVDSLFKIGELKTPQKQYFLGEKAKDNDIFRVLFRDLDLAKRAELINNFHPDLTVIIHYNVDETNLEWIHPTKKDFNMAFVGGAFMKNDLSSPEKRFEFLRLLLSDDLENSIKLSSSVVNAFSEKLEVPLTGDQDAKYIGQSCLPTGKKGVYCRNLQLTRYVHSPLVYGETLYQDNIKESQLLNKESDKTKNERVQQVAEAYYEGILNYIQSK
jgi:N-acetylmuramoyl-L-alanine amidase